MTCFGKKLAKTRNWGSTREGLMETENVLSQVLNLLQGQHAASTALLILGEEGTFTAVTCTTSKAAGLRTNTVLPRGDSGHELSFFCPPWQVHEMK